MEHKIKRLLALVIAVIMTLSVATYTGNESFTSYASAASASISIKKAPSLKASDIKYNSVKLTWGTTKSADSYKIYKSTDKKSWTCIATVKTTSYKASKLKTGTKYYFRLIAVSGKTKSPYSNTVAVTPMPEKVSSLKANVSSSTKASLSWGKVTGASGYQVYYSTSSDFKTNLKKITVNGADKTSCTLSGLKSGTKYYVKVRAIVKSGDKVFYGTFSSSRSFTTKSVSNSPSSSSTVYITETGTKFHRSSCSSLRKSKIAISRSKAIAQGYTACKICKP
ncbi:MAG: fibronectin type III domain-containing protein [Acutalibacteraceae bacterium]